MTYFLAGSTDVYLLLPHLCTGSRLLWSKPSWSDSRLASFCQVAMSCCTCSGVSPQGPSSGPEQMYPGPCGSSYEYAALHVTVDCRGPTTYHTGRGLWWPLLLLHCRLTNACSSLIDTGPCAGEGGLVDAARRVLCTCSRHHLPAAACCSKHVAALGQVSQSSLEKTAAATSCVVCWLASKPPDTVRCIRSKGCSQPSTTPGTFPTYSTLLPRSMHQPDMYLGAVPSVTQPVRHDLGGHQV